MGARGQRRRQTTEGPVTASTTKDQRTPPQPDQQPVHERDAPVDEPLTLEPPVIVPMTDEQFERAASTLAELLLWAWEQERDERRAA